MGKLHLSFSIILAVLIFQLPPAAAPTSELEVQSLLVPSDNTFVTDSTPTFRWTEVVGADNYELQYSTDNGFSITHTISMNNLRENSIELALADNTYYWRVRAGRDNGDVGPWSLTCSFILDTQPPATPLIIAPANGSYIRGSVLELSWLTVEGAANYRLLIDNDPDFSSPTENRILAEPKYTMTLPPDGRYFWKVASRDSAGNEAHSQSWVVTVDNYPPVAPELISPADGGNVNDNTPLLSWRAALDNWGIENYEIWIDGSLSKVVTDNIQTSENAPELADGPHTWRVRAFDHAVNENASLTWTFFVDTAPPPTPSKVAPADGTRTSSKTVAFEWLSVSDDGSPVTFYELWVDDDPGFGSPKVLENVAGNSENTQPPDGNYYWRVRAYDNAGNASEFENAWTLLVDNTPPPKPSLTWPKEGVEENTSRPIFSWVAVEDVSGVTYELQVDNDNDFLSPIYAVFLDNNQHKVDNSLPDDNYFWRVRAIDGLDHFGGWSDNVKFEVILRDFAILVDRTGVSILQGSQTSAMVQVGKIGSYNYLVNLSVSGQPQAMDVHFDRGGTPPYSSLMLVVAHEDTPAGSYTLVIKGSDAHGRERTDEFVLNVLSRPAATIKRMLPGDQKVVEIRKANVMEIEIGVLCWVENVAIYMIHAVPLEVPAPEGIVHSYFVIETENLSDNNLDSLWIKFQVERAWIQQNNIDTSMVHLHRYEAGGWRELITQEVGGDAVTIYFSASSPGFSTFAITGEKVQELFPSWLTEWWFLVTLIIVVVITVAVVLRKRRARPEELAGAWQEVPPPAPEEEEW